MGRGRVAIQGCGGVQADLPGNRHGGDQGGICWGRRPSRQARLRRCVLLCSRESAALVGFSHFSMSRASATRCASRCASPRLSAGQELGPLLPTPLLPVWLVPWCTATHMCVHTRARTHRAVSVHAATLIPSPEPCWHFLTGKESSCPAPICTSPSCPLHSAGRGRGFPAWPRGSLLPSSAWQEPWLRDTQPHHPPRASPSGSQSWD